MITIFGRVGKKSPIKDIIKKQSPKDFNLYVEPFVGSGAIYLNMDLKDTPAVINDLDKNLINAWRTIKSGITIDENTYNFPSKDKQEKYINSKKTSGNEIFIQALIKSLGTFGSTGKGKIYKPISVNNFKNKVRNAKIQKDYMKNTKVFSIDYKSIIKKFDGVNTYFFLDPPYENSKLLYNEDTMNFNELNNVLKNVKGKFLLTLNDSPEIRKIFKDFKILKLKVKGSGQYNTDTNLIGSVIRNELIIKNY